MQNFYNILTQTLKGTLDVLKQLNPDFNAPDFEYRICDSANPYNAYYDPLENKIVLCYQLVQKIMLTEILNDISSWKQNSIYSISFIFFHELGHAFIHLCGLPVLGKEEDAADALATLVSIEISPEMAYKGAVLFATLLNTGDMFWDAHSPSKERFYNILCWLYGSNPDANFWILERYPELESRYCTSEYLQLENSWSELLEDYCGFPLD